MTENSGGPAKNAHARPLPSLCPPFARAHCSAPFHSAPQLRGSQRSRSANRQFFSEKFPRLGSKIAAPAPALQGLFFIGNKFPQETATSSVCGGGNSRENTFLEENGCFKKKTQCFAPGKFAKTKNFFQLAKAAKFFRRPKPTSKINAHSQNRRPKITFSAAFSKGKSFSQYLI